MPHSDTLLKLVDDIYEAALDESLWPKVMRGMMAVTNSQGATFCILDSSAEPHFDRMVTENFDPTMIREYVDGVALTDPTIQAIAANPDRKIFHDSAYVSESEKDRNAYYDWHRTYSDTRHRIAGMAHPAPFLQSGVTLHRARRVGDFDSDAQRMAAVLFRHVERCLDTGFRLGTLGNVNAGVLSLLDGNADAVFLFDSRGRVIVANRAASELLEAGEGVKLQEGCLVLQRPSDNAVLQRLIGYVVDGAQTDPPGGVMPALRPSGKRPFAIAVSPLPGNAASLAAVHPAGCVVITDPDRAFTVSLEHLRTLYDLTPSEARLAQALGNGAELKSAATQLGISYATARAQLSSVFRKTQTRRQGELVKLLMTTPRALA